MMGIQESTQHFEDQQTFVASQSNGWADTIDLDLHRELGRQTPLRAVLEKADAEPAMPLRAALSAIRDGLDRRTRQWRGSAKVVEQTMRQLLAAEQARSEALQELAKIETDVARTGQALTMALNTFDETGESKNIDPRFTQSELALEALDRVTSDLLVAQQCCRAAWKAYSDALEQEEQLRRSIQSSEWAN